MTQASRQVQTQTQQQVQTLSPQQVLVVKLLELPAIELEDRVRAELLENPALEEGKEETSADDYADSPDTDRESPEDGGDTDYDSLSDYLTEDDIPDYKLQENNRSRDDKAEEIPFSDSTSFYETLKEQLGEVTPATIAAAPAARLQSAGISFRKVEYIRDFAAKVQSGALDLQEISRLPDDQAIKALASLKGIGVWTAEMILLFCLQRPDILSFDDLAIQRGLRMVYHHRSIDRKRFEK